MEYYTSPSLQAGVLYLYAISSPFWGIEVRELPSGVAMSSDDMEAQAMGLFRFIRENLPTGVQEELTFLLNDDVEANAVVSG